jgi:hypothetical protein
MSRELMVASARALRRDAVMGPVLAAVLLVLLTLPVLDDGFALQALRGIGVVLGLAVAVAVDDPAGTVLAASPFSAARRIAARVAVVLALAVPVWCVTASLVAWRADAPVAGIALETAGWWTLGLALAAGIWRRTGTLSPSYVAGPVLLALWLVAGTLPRGWAVLTSQTWGPPWEAAQIRWWAVLLAGAGLVAWALRDPLDQ